MSRLGLEHVSKSFAGERGTQIEALSDVSFGVEPKELIVLAGPSGCGKTTTLRLVAGLEKPTSGTIRIDDADATQVPPADRDVAMVFQNYGLYPHLSVYENIAFGLKLRKFSRAEIELRVSETAKILGLNDCLDRQPSALSGGERQRVALGRALVRRPRLLLLDEPLSGLDPRLREQTRRQLARLRGELGLTMLYVTHDQVEAMSLADRIVVLKAGAVQQVGTPEQIYETPVNQFVAGFFGTPPMNFFEGKLILNGAGMFFEFRVSDRAEHLANAVREEAKAPTDTQGLSMRLRIAGSSGNWIHPGAGKNVILGIRPEHIRVVRPESKTEGITGLLQSVERLGPETHLQIVTAGQAFIVRIFDKAPAEVKQPLAVAFDMDRAHYFDPATGRALGAR